MRRRVDQQMTGEGLSRRMRNRVDNEVVHRLRTRSFIFKFTYFLPFRIWPTGSCVVSSTGTACLWPSLSNFCPNLPFQLSPIQK
jgi:hypothetical protein